MKTLGIYNIKGGVGKTATAVNIGYLAAASGLRTLIWDLDPQGAATFYFRIKPKIKKSRRLLFGKKELDDAIKASDYEGLDLLPADFSYRNMDLLLNKVRKPELQLKRLLRPVAKDYDLVIFDCPPSISLVSENVFRAADTLLVPSIPTILSQRTLAQLLEFIQHNGLKAQVLSFYSMVDKRKGMHREICESSAQSGCKVLNTVIPYNVVVELMGMERRPVNVFAPRSMAGKAYRQLWEELTDHIGARVKSAT